MLNERPMHEVSQETTSFSPHFSSLLTSCPGNPRDETPELKLEASVSTESSEPTQASHTKQSMHQTVRAERKRSNGCLIIPITFRNT
ncbi:hypothetical protein BgiBS90_029544 [Biomphalaria glabrata]|nr:hypothetical protein BgiBS90_029544 [Biomphalaria glabrata]